MNFKNSNKLFIVGLSILLLVCILFNFFLIYLNNFNNFEVEIFNNKTQQNEIIKFCIDNKEEANNLTFEDKKTITYTTSYKFIDAFPDLENLKCLKKVVEVWDSSNENEYHFLYGTNLKIFENLNVLVNSLIVLLLFGMHKKDANKNYKLLGGALFIYFNFLLNSIFQIDNHLYAIFTDQKTVLLIFSIGFLISQLIYKNNILFISALFYYVIFDYEFLGIFVVVSYFLTKFNYQFTKVEKIALYFLPVAFFLSRFLAALSERFNNFWLGMFQDTYKGLSRFIDLQSDFQVLKCHTDMSISHTIKFMDVPITNFCEETIGYGPIRKLIPLYGDIWNSVLIAIVVLFLLILLQYKDLLRRYSSELIIVTLLFVSPPLNLLVHLSNPDIFYLAILYFVLKNYKTYPVTGSLIIYIFTLWKVHAVGILFGLLIFSLIQENRKNIFTNLTFLILTLITYIIDIRTTEPLSIPASPDERMGFGLLHDATQLTKFIDFNNQSYIILFAVFISISVLIIVARLWNKIDNKVLIKYKSYEVYGFAFWFFLSMIFQNQTYRLPLYIFLIIHVFKHSNNLIRNSIIFTIFLNPVFVSNYLMFEKITLLLNRIGIYIVFSYLLSIFLYDFWNNLIKKYVNSERNYVE